jgi:hypothetical protein
VKAVSDEKVHWTGRIGSAFSGVSGVVKDAMSTSPVSQEEAEANPDMDWVRPLKEAARQRVKSVVYFHCLWCKKLQSFPLGATFTLNSLTLCPECRALQERITKEAEKALCRPSPCNCCGNDLAPDENQCCGNCQHEKGQNGGM